jgi:hypothetical protein
LVPLEACRPVSFKDFCDVAKVRRTNHPKKNNLAKFGYILDMKVGGKKKKTKKKQKQNRSILLAT